MSSFSMDQLKVLRDETGVSLMQCREALEAAAGDLDRARSLLAEKSAAIAEKKSSRTLGAGAVAAYVHGGSVGALVRLASETDFVARAPEFRALADDLAMHISAMAPASLEELRAQPFIKDPEKTIGDLERAAVQKFGERVEISGFARL